MTDDQMPSAIPTTRFPFINLAKAVERAKVIFDADQRGREMAISTAFEVWGYSAKSSGGFQTIGALKMYGLIKDSGGGTGRKIALTEEVLRYFRDEREEERVKLLRSFATKPKLIAALWSTWSGSPPADTVARSHLKNEVGLNEQSARTLLAIYKENIEFADLKGFHKGLERAPEPAHFPVNDPPSAEPFMPSVMITPAPATARTEVGNPAVVGGDISAYMDGTRLQIRANVDLAGLERLKRVLDKYEEILKLFS